APSGRSTPAKLSVPVYAGQPTVITVNYLLAQSPPGGVELPVAVPSTNISDLADYPFGFNGQLQSGVGYGSGAAVQAKVVPPVAAGGYGGYLPSDAVPNSWLSSTAEKMLVGYPVDGSLFGDASIVPGEMYQTQPQPYPLSLATDPVANQQVYTAPWFLGYPG